MILYLLIAGSVLALATLGLAGRGDFNVDPKPVGLVAATFILSATAIQITEILA